MDWLPISDKPLPELGFDPLLDFPPGLAQRSVIEKLTAVARIYGPEVRYGRRGLPLIINDNPQSLADWQDYEQAWRQLNNSAQRPSGGSDLQQRAEQALLLYQAREQQIVWALQALDFDPQEVLGYLASSEPSDQTLLPLSWELFQRHGPCPEDFDPSHAGTLSTVRQEKRQQRLAALQKIYTPILAQIDSWQQAGSDQQLQRAAELEGQFFWTAEYLHLDPGWALTRLSITS